MFVKIQSGFNDSFKQHKFHMEKYIELVNETIPGFKPEDIDKPFNMAGIESMDLVILRVSFEKKFLRIVPASVWLNFTSISQIINYYQSFENENK